MKSLCQVILIFLISTSACAENSEMMDQVFDNISSEFAVCGSYFVIVSKGLRNSGQKAAADQYEKASETSFIYALTAAEKSRSKEMAKKVTEARSELSLKEMLEEIGNDVTNISILMNKYALPCKRALENPEAMMKEWVDRVLDRHYKPKK